ncbi:hypothetical protein AB0B25_29260 [Nocardia sp. NPDC049190]|uniref:hypothetical protein n=1 Tax=Nocardia sp. NPDC049190 TaxID=3155650 RepID=UPI00340F0F0D
MGAEGRRIDIRSVRFAGCHRPYGTIGFHRVTESIGQKYHASDDFEVRHRGEVVDAVFDLVEQILGLDFHRLGEPGP